MNRRDALTTVALAGAAIAATGSAKADTAPGSTLERIKKSGVLRIAVIAGQDPYFHKDLTTNQWSGACIDMANDIAGKLGAKVETLESTWGNQILDLQAEKIDLAFAVNPTPERSLVIDFSTPILVHSFTAILIALDGRKASLHQQVSRSGRFERTANMVAQVHDLVDAERSNVRKDGFERRTISVHIRDGSKFHLASPFEMADDSPNAGRCRDSGSL